MLTTQSLETSFEGPMVGATIPSIVVGSLVTEDTIPTTVTSNLVTEPLALVIVVLVI